MIPSKTPVFRFVLLLSLLSGIAWQGTADTVNFNNNCDGQTPTGRDGKWFGHCGEYEEQTNWENNVIPESADHAVIGEGYGPIDVDGHATVQSVQVQEGLILDHSSWDLTLSNDESTITGLVLLNNAEIYANPGVVVNLSGMTRLGAHVTGPGIYIGSGNLNLNYCRLWFAAVLINLGVADLSSANGPLSVGDGNTTFINSGSLAISNGADVEGAPGARLINEGSINVSSAGTTSYIMADYEQRGALSVVTGILEIKGASNFFESGTINVEPGAALRLSNTPWAPPHNHKYAGLTSFNGGGLVDVYEDYIVEAPLIIALGSGDPSSGSGGFRLQSDLELSASVWNRGRFRFNGGGISFGDPVATFTNEVGAWAYTRHLGGAYVDVHFVNYGSLQLGGADMFVSDLLTNQPDATFRILAGNISGIGPIWNRGNFTMEATDPATVSLVATQFGQWADGSVKVTSGRLIFDEDLVNLDGGTLSAGTWSATPPRNS